MRIAMSFNSLDDRGVDGLDSDDDSVDSHDVGDDQQNQRRQNGRKNFQGSKQLGLLLRIASTL